MQNGREKKQKKSRLFLYVQAVCALTDQKVSSLCWLVVHSYTYNVYTHLHTHTRMGARMHIQSWVLRPTDVQLLLSTLCYSV